MDLNVVSSRGIVLIVMATGTLALALGLSNSGANKAANRWLALFLLVLAGVALDYTIQLSRLDREWRWLSHFPCGFTLALGPLIWCYVHRLVVGRTPRRLWLHFLPVGLQALYLVALYLAPDSLRAPLIDGRGRDPIAAALRLALPVSLVVYAAANLGLLGRYRRWVVQARSDADLLAAPWIRNLLVVLIVTALGEAAIRAADLLGLRANMFDVYPFYVWLLAAGCYFGVEARQYLERPFPPITTDAAVDEQVVEPGKDWAALGEQWLARTREAGWWRDPALTLATVARRLGVNTGYLSRAINQGLGQNFNEMINGIRAEAVADQIDREEEASDLLALALEAGFGSKSSFNRAFRARFGVPPSEYRARVRS
jgi:AraC-like DNA-binding protein